MPFLRLSRMMRSCQFTSHNLIKGVRLSGLTLADVGVSDVSLWVLEVKRFTLFTVVSRRVVFTVIADATAEVS